MYELRIIGGFSSAHKLRDYEGKCENLHGHNWKVEVFIEAERTDKSGLVIDFKLLKEKLDSITSEIDHCYINDIEYFHDHNPTSENIAEYIFERMKSSLENYALKLKKITVWENEKQSASYFK
ncbi:MAG: 6-carboxytetrahydropterin synthase QueD [Candidatus Omnitrophica bacterium]|nr:6-carboxytetrahydropterin synthase QueD [Candidatus Omnitrophota bacterium]